MSAHDCVQRINELLAGKNTQISTAISFGDPSRELIRVATVKAAPGRGKPVNFFASFCPFCGRKLSAEAAPATQEPKP